MYMYLYEHHAQVNFLLHEIMCMLMLCIYTCNTHVRVCSTSCTVADQQSPAVAESPLTFSAGEDKGERFIDGQERKREEDVYYTVRQLP